jgi:nicotinamide phosphoribosyltransferase
MIRETSENLLELTDEYKFGHPRMRVHKTLGNFEYMASREGALFPYTVLTGLQPLLKRYFVGQAFVEQDIYEAKELCDLVNGPGVFFTESWQELWDKHNGMIPLDIRAVPEGLKVPVGKGNVLMTVKNTDEDFEFVAGTFESLLQTTWYPSAVATFASSIRGMIQEFVLETGGEPANVDWMLHDFGVRSTTCMDQARIGGAGHMLSFKGSDNRPAIRFLLQQYADPNIATPANSVWAAEHNVMTQLGKMGEWEVIDFLFGLVNKGIISMPTDSYDHFRFLDMICERADLIKSREGFKVVARPDSVQKPFDRPAEMLLDTVEQLGRTFGTTLTSTGHYLLDPHVGALWGDGLKYEDIEACLEVLTGTGWAAHNVVFGMGGGLLHSGVSRDMQRTAIKSSAQQREDGWHVIRKETPGKVSHGGLLKLVGGGEYGMETVTIDDPRDSLLQPVFYNGDLLREMTLGEVRRNLGWIN